MQQLSCMGTCTTAVVREARGGQFRRQASTVWTQRRGGARSASRPCRVSVVAVPGQHHDRARAAAFASHSGSLWVASRTVAHVADGCSNCCDARAGRGQEGESARRLGASLGEGNKGWRRLGTEDREGWRLRWVRGTRVGEGWGQRIEKVGGFAG
eukprot:356133-Chlamydomonas_euryale.AAC.18